MRSGCCAPSVRRRKPSVRRISLDCCAFASPRFQLVAGERQGPVEQRRDKRHQEERDRELDQGEAALLAAAKVVPHHLAPSPTCLVAMRTVDSAIERSLPSVPGQVTVTAMRHSTTAAAAPKRS